MTATVPSTGALRRLDGPLANRSGAFAMLCLHSVSDAELPFLAIGPERFERQLALLRRRGYRSASVGELATLAEGARPPGRRVLLTFDDGFRDNHDVVLPLLRAYGQSALIFVLPGHLDAGAALDWPEVAGEHAAHPQVMRSMTWPMVEAMAEAGVEFGAHTLTHPHLTRLGDDALRQELSDARARLRARLGACDTLAYPFGDWDGRVAMAARDAGYRFAFTLPNEGQRSATPLSLPRIPIDHRDDERRFAVKLTSAYRRLVLSPAKPILGRLRDRARLAVPGRPGG